MPEDLLVISSYPRKDEVHGSKTVGVASYAKNTLLSIKSTSKNELTITVLAEKLPGTPDSYQDSGITVHRLWQRGNLLSLWQLTRTASRHPATKILIEFEMAMFGPPLVNLFFPLLLTFLKFKKKKVFLVLHQVVTDFGELTGHLGYHRAGFTTRLYSLAVKLFYTLIGLLAHRLIVFEDFLKKRLSRFVAPAKITVIPHGVEPPPTARLSQSVAKKQLGLASSDFVIGLFGYLAWYKGTDWLAEKVSRYLDSNADPNLKLLLIGGPNPNHLTKKYYRDYLASLEDLAKKHPDNIIITGFINEGKIPVYFQAVDLMVFPYRTGMSSSGPLALTFRHQTPFLVSDKLAPLFDTPDLSKTLKQHRLWQNHVVFRLSDNSFVSRLKRFENPRLKKPFRDTGRDTTLARSWTNIGQKYAHLLSQ